MRVIPTATRAAENAPLIEMNMQEPEDKNLPVVHSGKPDPRQPGPPATPMVDFARMPADIVNAVVGVMGEIGVIEKAGYNKFHQYSYARIEDILQALTPLMAKHGIAVFQSEMHREMFDDGKVMAVTYRFVVAHKSGVTAPPQEQSGMARCRDSKQGFDDKSLAKAHTQARKYFLLALFQIPSDVDSDAEGTGGDKKSRVPPAQRGAPQQDAENTESAPTESPHYVKAMTMEEWCLGLAAKIEHATTNAEIDAILHVNSLGLAKVGHDDNARWKDIGVAVSAKRTKLRQVELDKQMNTKTIEPALKPDPAIPNPATDPEAFLKWADRQLGLIDETTRDSLGDIIENVIEPRTAGLMPPDIEELHALYDKHNKRLEP